MASYDQLRNYFNESDNLRAAARRAAEFSIVQGFVLDVDPVWCLLYDIEDGLADWPTDFALDRHEWRHILMHFPDPYYRGLSVCLHDHLRSLAANRYQGYRERDLYKLQDFARSPQSSAVSMTIVHRPLLPPAEATRSTDSDDEAQLRSLVGIARESGGLVRIEERPLARLALAVGDKISTNSGRAGTIGGVLKSTTSAKSYGLTCAHVARQGDQIHDGSGNLIGLCIADTKPVALRSGLVCDPVNLKQPNPSPGNGPELNMLDAAFIDLIAPIQQATLGGVAQSLSQGQNVTLKGAATGITHHKLGSLCLSYSFHQGTSNFCFRDAIEIWPVSWSPFGGRVGQVMSKLPTQGDSGGWVLIDDQPPIWAGVFFGEDGYRGFAIRASWVHAWAEKNAGVTLTP